MLLMHGEPTWSFLYRHMIPVLVRAGYRAVAPDLVGFGRSDKPTLVSDYSYQRHVDWMKGWLEATRLDHITLVCQNWGSLIGLRLATEHPERFDRIVVANGFLPTGDYRVPFALRLWQMFAKLTPWFPAGRIVSLGCRMTLPRDTIAAYAAPFPKESYKKGARAFPMLVPTRPDDPAAPANRRAWEVLRHWEKPFLTAFSDGDPFTRGADRVFQKLVPGAAGQPHTTIRGAGHFLQEEKGSELAQVVVDFMERTR
jgi:haloalkane dehalogenase